MLKNVFVGYKLKQETMLYSKILKDHLCLYWFSHENRLNKIIGLNLSYNAGDPFFFDVL